MQVKKQNILNKIPVKQHYPQNNSKLSLDYIDKAIRNYEVGQFYEVGQVAKRMLLDEHFASFVDQRTLLTLQKELVYKTEVKEETLTNNWLKTIEETTLQKIIKSYILYNLAICWIDWEKVDGIYYPKIKHLNPQYIKYKPQEECFYYRFKNGEKKIEEKSGRWLFINGYTPGEAAGVVVRCAKAWACAEMSKEDWQTANEAYNNPFIVINEKENSSSIEEDRVGLASEINNQKRDRVLFLESGQQIDIKPSHGGTYSSQPFSDFLRNARTSYAMAILGGNLTTEVVGGSYAAAQVHSDTLQKYIEADCNLLAKSLNKLNNIIYYLNNNLKNVGIIKFINPERKNIDELLKIKQFLGDKQIKNIEEIVSFWGIKI